ncbi:MAG: hydrogenase expression/formation protein HypE, partial [Thermoplasmata archaeon]
IVSAKDPTRGGLSNALNEWAEKSGIGIEVEEESIPVKDGVRSACEMLGIDVYSVGNEGKVILGVVKEKAEEVLEEIRKDPLGRDAQIIGEVKKNYGKRVVLKTRIGGKRILSKPVGDPIPRIC